jgi:GTP-binding protein EngB required for normal cell division
MSEISYEKLTVAMSGVMQKMQSYVAVNEKLSLPKPHTEFVAAKHTLEEGKLRIAVCGKVKNGKSSFINAIIGRELLPVCSDVATSQVFVINHAEKDSFFVVYANGDRKAIPTKEELVAYGSQATIDSKGVMDADKSILYIEVNTPLEFLPKGVSIIDTPGISSTYPQHTAITKRYLKMADAVLFIANPSPLEKIETDFLKEIVEVTPNIMFVTTKIDENGIESVESNIANNTKKITETIGGKLYRPVKMLKMSSKILLEAALTDSEKASDFKFRHSHFQEVKEELLNTICLTRGYYQVGYAYNESLKYYNAVLQSIEKRLQTALAEGEKANKIANQITEARARLNRFGRQEQVDIMAEVDNRLRAFDLSFRQKMQMNGAIVSKYDSIIDNLKYDDIQELADNLPGQLTEDLKNEWTHLQETLVDDITRLLENYVDEIQTVPNEGSDVVLFSPNGIGEMEKVGFRKYAVNARNEAYIGIGGVAILDFIGATAIPIIGPLVVLGGLGYTLYGLFAGRTRAKAEVLTQNQNALKRFVRETVQDFGKQYMEVSLENGQYNSLLDGYKLNLHNYADQVLSSTYAAYLQEVKALENVRDSNKAESATLLRGIKEKWEGNKPLLADVRKQLEEIGQGLKQ